jgi:hypothetical protein
LVVASCESLVVAMPKASWVPSSKVYTSVGKLLIRPVSSAVIAFGQRVDVNPNQSLANQLWSIDFRFVREVLMDQGFLRSVLDRLSGRVPGMTPEILRSRIMAEPTVLSSEKMLEHFKAREKGTEGSDEGSDDSSGTRQRLQIISISATGETPEVARVLASSVMHGFLIEARRRSSEDYTRVRELLDAQLHTNQAQLARMDKSLLNLTGTVSAQERSSEEAGVEQEIRLIETEKATIRGRVLQLEQQVRLARQPTLRIEASQNAVNGSSGPVDLDQNGGADRAPKSIVPEDASTARVELASAEAIYKPNSHLMQPVRERVAQLEHFQASKDRYRSGAEVADLSHGIVSLEKNLAGLNVTQAHLSALLTSPAQAAKLRRMESAEEQVQQATLALVPQVYNARIQEHQAQSRGSILIIDEPQPGVLVVGRVNREADWTPAIVMVPIAAFVGVVLVSLVDRLYVSIPLGLQLSDALEVPILAVLPSLRNRSRSSVALLVAGAIVVLSLIAIRFWRRWRFHF